jgi:hypothetical protein
MVRHLTEVQIISLYIVQDAELLHDTDYLMVTSKPLSIFFNMKTGG